MADTGRGKFRVVILVFCFFLSSDSSLTYFVHLLVLNRVSSLPHFYFIPIYPLLLFGRRLTSL